MKILRLIFVLVVAVAGYGCQDKISCKNLKSQYLSLTAQLNTRDDSLVFLDKVSKALQKTPNCIKALQIRGSLYAAFEKNVLAKNDFSKATNLDSNNVYSLYYLSVLLWMEGVNDSALYCLEKAIDLKYRDGYVLNTNNLFFENLDIDFYEIIYMRSIILFELGLYKNSKQNFLAYLAEYENKHPKDSYAYLAAIYSLEKQVDSACFYHSIGMRYDPKFVIDTTLILKCGNYRHDTRLIQFH